LISRTIIGERSLSRRSGPEGARTAFGFGGLARREGAPFFDAVRETVRPIRAGGRVLRAGGEDVLVEDEPAADERPLAGVRRVLRVVVGFALAMFTPFGTVAL
jgi:hypothetical protein